MLLVEPRAVVAIRATTRSVDSDRLEKLVTQVLEETRAFRRETKEDIADLRREMNENFARVDERFTRVDEQFAEVRRDLRLVQAAVLETSQGLKDLRAKVDEHDARLDKLEGAAE